MNTWVLFTFAMLLWTSMYKFLCEHMLSFLLDVYLRLEFLNHMSHFEDLLDCFPKWLHHFTFPSAGYEGSIFSPSSPTLVTVCHFDYSHPSGCEVLSPCGFYLHFPGGWWCQVSFHVLLIICLSSFENYLFILCPFFNGVTVFVFLLLTCKCSLCILGTSPLSDIWFTNTFSHSVSQLFTCLMVSFKIQKF